MMFVFLDSILFLSATIASCTCRCTQLCSFQGPIPGSWETYRLLGHPRADRKVDRRSVALERCTIRISRLSHVPHRMGRSIGKWSDVENQTHAHVER